MLEFRNVEQILKACCPECGEGLLVQLDEGDPYVVCPQGHVRQRISRRMQLEYDELVTREEDEYGVWQEEEEDGS